MRLFAVLVAVLLVGCGVGAEETNAPGSSGEAPTTIEPLATFDESELKPPPIFLISRVGKQEAVPGSSCVDYLDQASGQGVSQCGDVGAPLVPKEMTVVERGESVIVTIPGVTLKRDSSVSVRPLGCLDRESVKLDLPEAGELHWDVDLDRDAYELDVFALFDAGNGLSGDMSGTLGLLVGGGPKDHDYRGVLALDRSLAVCPFGA